MWIVAGVVLLAGVVVWWVWPSAKPAPRARPYLEYTACLLTDSQGVGGGQAAAVWGGMQRASLATQAKVQYLPVLGETTAANALPYLATLVQRRCAVVFAVGTAQIAAVAADAPKYPAVRFVTLGGAASGANVTNIDETDSVRVADRVDGLLRAAVRSAAP
jgi:basic membrane lipoprotein Med (substrate-binding protein (PBP1-ABC) superfamily)